MGRGWVLTAESDVQNGFIAQRHRARPNLKGSCVTCQKCEVNWALNESADEGTNSTELGSLLEKLKVRQMVKKFPALCGKNEGPFRGHKRPPLVSILSQIIPCPSAVSNPFINITLPSTPSFSQCSVTFVFPHPTGYIAHSIFESLVALSGGVSLPVLLSQLSLRWSIKNEMGRACGTYGRQERCVLTFGGETWGKTLLGRRRRICEDNIKMIL